MRKSLYKRVDIHDGVYSSLVTHVSDANPPVFILKQRGRQAYYVVDDVEWWEAGFSLSGLAMSMDEIAEITLHQTAERFDTLEQAVLYFNAVAV